MIYFLLPSLCIIYVIVFIVYGALEFDLMTHLAFGMLCASCILTVLLLTLI